jgi:hypothetical protein
MSRIFEVKKQSLDKELERFRESPVLRVIGQQSEDQEWRAILAFATQTLVKGTRGDVVTGGPVVCGIRYHARFLSEIPHPLEVATVLDPPGVFHPNVNPTTGAICVGHLQVAVPLDFIINLIWAGITLNMKAIDTRPGNLLNPEAAQWVVANAHRLPLSAKGLWEEPG